MDITVIILTYNESLHIERCIKSLLPITNNINVIDSFSTDSTVKIASRLGAKVYSNSWINYAKQFQWALENTNINSKWVMRMDADEYLTDELVIEINKIDSDELITKKIKGFYIKRQVHFMGKWIKHGGFYPIKLMRIWEKSHGKIESKWMDEHIILDSGNTMILENDLIDKNLNNLSWWINKHNSYSTREAIDILNKSYNLFQSIGISSKISKKSQDKNIRWYKENVYLKFPKYVRAFLYFLFRYFFKLGFLDGKQGIIWHFLQSFWYRFLVDAKVDQILYISKTKNQTIHETIKKDFNINI